MPVISERKYSSPSDGKVNLSKYKTFYRLDCTSGEGLINSLLPELEKTSNDDFNFYLSFILKKCINVNRSFSDAVEFLSIWLKKSPDSLLEKLKSAKLKEYFNRTEYDQEGDQWHFPRLLQTFLTLIEKESVTANEILDYLFETLDFFNIPEAFVREIIGYDRLEQCIKDSPEVFKPALLLKINEFVKKNETIDIGSHSHRYLIQEIDPIKKMAKEIDRQKLVVYMRVSGGFFTYPSVKNFRLSETCILSYQSNYSRGSGY